MRPATIGNVSECKEKGKKRSVHINRKKKKKKRKKIKKRLETEHGEPIRKDERLLFVLSLPQPKRELGKINKNKRTTNELGRGGRSSKLPPLIKQKKINVPKWRTNIGNRSSGY